MRDEGIPIGESLWLFIPFPLHDYLDNHPPSQPQPELVQLPPDLANPYLWDTLLSFMQIDEESGDTIEWALSFEEVLQYRDLLSFTPAGHIVNTDSIGDPLRASGFLSIGSVAAYLNLIQRCQAAVQCMEPWTLGAFIAYGRLPTFSSRWIILPIPVEAGHWAVAEVDVDQKSVSIYDPLSPIDLSDDLHLYIQHLR